MSLKQHNSNKMIEPNVQCPSCGKIIEYHYYTYWSCGSCGMKYPCTNGIPKLYLEDSLDKADKKLRDSHYNTILGKIYNFLDPFLLISVRPIRISLIHWLVYFITVSLLGFLVYFSVDWILIRAFSGTTFIDLILLSFLLIFILVLIKKRYLAWLLLLAIPGKISTSLHKFKPLISHASVHSGFMEEYLDSTEKLQILDISTGSCNALMRHGWLKLTADFTAVDLSEMMIMQGIQNMNAKGAPVDFILCDATKLPFRSETFDIVTNYGAVNGYADPGTALAEMVRVTKKGGKILFLDEQLYSSASWVEKLYFNHVLTSENTVAGCPVDLLPEQLDDVQVHQVRQFIYICTARKRIG